MMGQLKDSPPYDFRLPLSTSARRFRLIFLAFFSCRSPMALVVECAVLKIPVMSPGDTPPRCDRRRRPRRVHLRRRGMLDFLFGPPRVGSFYGQTVLGVDKREDVR